MIPTRHKCHEQRCRQRKEERGPLGAEGTTGQTSVRGEGWPRPPSHPLSLATLSLSKPDPNPSHTPLPTEHKPQGTGAWAAKTEASAKAGGRKRVLSARPGRSRRWGGSCKAPLEAAVPGHLHPAPRRGIPRTHFPRLCTHHRTRCLQ